MLDDFFETTFTLHRLRSGPSGPYIDGFAQKLKKEGCSKETARRFLRSAAHIGRFAEITPDKLIALLKAATLCEVNSTKMKGNGPTKRSHSP